MMNFKVGGKGTANLGSKATTAKLKNSAARSAVQPAPAPAAAPPPPKGGDSNAVQAAQHYAPAATATATAAKALDPKSTDALAVRSLQDEIKALIKSSVPAGRSSNVTFTADGANWTVGELQAIADLLKAMPPKDRAALGSAEFKRTKELPAHGDRPDYGRVDYQSSDDGGKLTISLSNVAAQDLGIFKNVAAHEMAHAVQGGGRFEANAIREFGKLSGWTEKGPPESIVDGYADSHETLNREAAYPKNGQNFVGEYAKESAAEDFAESYRAYLTDPKLLMEKAPEKFLYINAQSGKYSAAEVQQLAADAGVDLQLSMALLRKSNLRPETVQRIGQAHMLLGTGDAAKAAGDAISAIQERATEPGFVQALRGNPRAALGEAVWNSLSDSERKLLDDDAYVDKLASAAAANKLAVPDKIADAEVGAWKQFWSKLQEPPSFFQKLKLLFSVNARVDYVNKILKDPAIWNAFSPETRRLIQSKAGQDAIRKLVGSVGITGLMSMLWGVIGGPDKKAKTNVNRSIGRLGPAEVSTLLEAVKRGQFDQNLANQIVDVTNNLAKTGMWRPKDDWIAFG